MMPCASMATKPDNNKASRFGQAVTITVCCRRHCLDMNKHACYRKDASSFSLFIFHHRQ
jgi:hypothetical protein